MHSVEQARILMLRGMYIAKATVRITYPSRFRDQMSRILGDDRSERLPLTTEGMTRSIFITFLTRYSIRINRLLTRKKEPILEERK